MYMYICMHMYACMCIYIYIHIAIVVIIIIIIIFRPAHVVVRGLKPGAAYEFQVCFWSFCVAHLRSAPMY